jgi:hypothetical protein
MRKIKPDLETVDLVSLLPVGSSGSKWYMILAVARGPRRGFSRVARRNRPICGSTTASDGEESD